MKNLWEDFKAFVNKGNFLEIAIAFVMAIFFAPIITAIVDGVIMNLIAAIFGQPNFDSITIDVGDSTLLIGSVLTAIAQFVIVAFVLFLILKAYNKMRPPAEAGPTEVELLTEIRDALRNR